jgi:NAD(P)-dependent dehydrogenase (short-subunit alcohol dehydrogenase family)
MGQVSFVPVDLSQPGAAEELVAVAAERGGIDILVNNVGGATVHACGLVSLSDDEWQAAWDLNVMAAVRSTRAALPEIERCGGGSIVIIGSISAYLANPETYAYCVTKAGLAKFSKALSIELAPKNIRVNLVSPGAVLTEIWTDRGRMAAEYAAADGRTAEEVRAAIIESTPTGRFTTPEQVADLVLFLASDRAGNTTGSDYRIDGGYVTTL